MKKHGLTFERHQAVGAELQELTGRLLQVVLELGAAYPFTGERGRAIKHLDKARKTVDLARSCLDDRVFDEHPGEATPDVYYGQTTKQDDIK